MTRNVLRDKAPLNKNRLTETAGRLPLPALRVSAHREESLSFHRAEQEDAAWRSEGEPRFAGKAAASPRLWVSHPGSGSLQGRLHAPVPAPHPLPASGGRATQLAALPLRWAVTKILALCLCCGLFFIPQVAHSLKLTPKSETPGVEQVYNPKPSPGDVLLPMPGGLKMTLRPVCVPAGGYLDDVQQPFGIGSAAAEDGTPTAEAWSDRRYTASITAPFELADLPASWGDSPRQWLNADPASAAASGNGLRPFLYFIGKYEVSRAQWRAVMEPDKEFKLQPGDDQPITNISWFDALEFTRRYSEWLMRHHPDSLPFFRQENRSAFIRLPTEAEWEYAARGGHKVSPVERERTRLHPAPEQADMGEYIIASQFDTTLTAPAAIGSRKGNPLDLHDMLGNSAEMVQTPFRLIAAGQQVGNQGGFVIKGGSWRAANLINLHPGRRIEADYYVDGSAQKRDDMGFRVSLGSILSPKDRHTILKEEWEKKTAPRTALAPTAPTQDVRILIREVVREVESPELKQRLAEAEEVASLYHAQVNAGEERMMHELLLGAAFSLETIANYAARCYQLIKLMDAYAKLAPQEQKNQEKKIAGMRKDIRGFVIGMQGVLHYYREMLRTMSGMDIARLEQQLAAVRLQFNHEDGFSRNIAKRLKVLHGHVNNDTPQNPPFARDDLEILKDILPDWLMPSLKKYWET